MLKNNEDVFLQSLAQATPLGLKSMEVEKGDGPISANTILLETLQFIASNQSSFLEYKEFYPKPNPALTYKNRRMSLWVIAAALLLITLLFLGLKPQKAKMQFALLPDQSMIQLYNNSKIEKQSNFNEKDRVIELDGNAFFNIHHDETRPFKVFFGDNQLTVLGTSFTVEQNDYESEISVREGKVLVESQSHKLLVLKGESAKIDVDGIITKTNFERHDDLVNKNFEQASILEVFQYLKEFHNVEFKFEDSNTSTHCTYNGTFKNASITDVLDEFSILFKLEYKIEKKYIHIKSFIC